MTLVITMNLINIINTVMVVFLQDHHYRTETRYGSVSVRATEASHNERNRHSLAVMISRYVNEATICCRFRPLPFLWLPRRLCCINA